MRRLLCILALLLPLCSQVLQGQDTSAQESRKSKLEREIALIEKQLKENAGKNSNALARATLLQEKINVRSALVAENEKEIKRLSDSVYVQSREIRVLQARLDTLSLYYGRLVKNAYLNRDARVWYMYLLASDNIGQAVKRYGYLRGLSRTMSSQALKIKELQKSLSARKKQLEAMKGKAEATRRDNKKALESLKTERKEADALIGKLGKQKKKYEKDLASKKKQVQALNKEIQKIIAAQLKAAGSSSTVATSGNAAVASALATEFAASKGSLPFPCEGAVVGRFGKRNHPVYTKIEMPFSNGIDISVLSGTKVRCVFDGEVRKVIVMPGYNKCVLVQHGDYFTFYCKLGSVDVKVGDKVKTGQDVGTVDTIDSQTQLHFQLWRGSQPQDPLEWLKP